MRAAAYLAGQSTALRTLAPAAATGDDDAVHDARTATRRLRTALAVCGPLLPDEPVVTARSALRELGHALGAVRDPAIELAWLEDALGDLPPEAVVGPVRERLEAELGSSRAVALEALRRLVGTADHARLLATLDGLAAGAGTRGGRRIRHRAGVRWRRLDHALEVAGSTPAGMERDAALHEARKAARHARYAAELVGSWAARRSARRAEAVQDALGAQHDAVLARAAAAAARRGAIAAGEPGTTYDDLRARAQQAAERAEAEAAPAVARARRRGHRRWAR